MITAYCPTCRTYYDVTANPPYAVIHVLARDEQPIKHLHAITREELKESDTGVQMLNDSYVGHSDA